VADDRITTNDDFDVLACELDKRPQGAPSFSDLQGAVRGLRREEGTLVVAYDPAVAASLEELAAAERLCCATIGFEVTHAPVLTLRIAAAPAQLDIFEAFLAL
jgi:hypothetical protein